VPAKQIKTPTKLLGVVQVFDTYLKNKLKKMTKQDTHQPP